MEQKFGRLQGKKYVYIHNDLSNAAFHFRTRIEERLAKDDRVGITFDCMSCLVMCAFSFEAYINFLGSKLIAGWKERQPFDDKLEQVLKNLGIQPDRTQRPYSAIERLKTFRDTVAHGKPDEEEYDRVVEIKGDGSDARPDLTGEWQHICQTDSVFEIYDDIEDIWREMLEKSGLSVFDTLSHGEGGLTFMEKANY